MIAGSKKTILCCWPYYRMDWIMPFIELQEFFEFVFISYFKKPENELDIPFRKIYWSEFLNANHILEEEKPQKVIFMSIDDGFSASLNFLARKKGIGTYVLQHGLFHDYNFYRQQERFSKRNGHELNPDYLTKTSDTLSFVYKSLKRYPLALLIVVETLVISRFLGKNRAIKQFSLGYFKALKYIGYTAFNCRIHLQRDHARRGDIIEIGNPSFDLIINHQKKFKTEPYYLLIDQPFLDSPFVNFGLQEFEVTRFYEKLNQFCIGEDAKLYIKLHPESYNSELRHKHPNITYIKEANLNSLIANSKGCFGTFSNLIIPTIYLRPCYLFTLPSLQSQTQDDLIQIGIVGHLPFLTFESKEIMFDSIRLSAKDNSEFKEKYLFKDDGKSLERLKEVLKN